MSLKKHILKVLSSILLIHSFLFMASAESGSDSEIESDLRAGIDSGSETELDFRTESGSGYGIESDLRPESISDPAPESSSDLKNSLEPPLKRVRTDPDSGSDSDKINEEDAKNLEYIRTKMPNREIISFCPDSKKFFSRTEFEEKLKSSGIDFVLYDCGSKKFKISHGDSEKNLLFILERICCLVQAGTSQTNHFGVTLFRGVT